MSVSVVLGMDGESVIPGMVGIPLMSKTVWVVEMSPSESVA